ncbi:hypothetical protein [Kaarinaea lacus]
MPLLREHINRISSYHLGNWWDFLIKFFVPATLGLIFIGDLYNELQKPYGDYSWTALLLIGRDWLIATLAIAFVITLKPWRTDHLSSISGPPK